MSQIGWILFSWNSTRIFSPGFKFKLLGLLSICIGFCVVYFRLFVSVLCLVLNVPRVFWFFIFDFPHRYSLTFIPLVGQELITLPEQQFCGIRVAQSVVFCVVFCRSLFVPLSCLFWPLYCLFSWLPAFNKMNCELMLTYDTPAYICSMCIKTN